MEKSPGRRRKEAWTQAALYCRAQHVEAGAQGWSYYLDFGSIQTRTCRARLTSTLLPGGGEARWMAPSIQRRSPFRTKTRSLTPCAAQGPKWPGKMNHPVSIKSASFLLLSYHSVLAVPCYRHQFDLFPLLLPPSLRFACASSLPFLNIIPKRGNPIPIPSNPQQCISLLFSSSLCWSPQTKRL